MTAIDGGLTQVLREALPEVHWCRIETGGTGRGIPDINGCYRGAEFWCELKFTDTWAVGLRPEQCGWAMQRSRAGGRVFILTRRRTQAGPRRGPGVDELYIHSGADAREVATLGLRGGPLPLYRAGGGPSQWSWKDVLRILTDG